jgi:transposase
MEMWNEVHRRILVEGAPKRSIRREYRIGSETLAKVLASPEPPGYRLSAPRPRPKVGDFLGVIDEILIADRTAPPKQKHTSKRIFERLRDEHGYTGGITQVKEAVAAARMGRGSRSCRCRTRRARPSSTSVRRPW